jgi:hypothetical protein
MVSALNVKVFRKATASFPNFSDTKNCKDTKFVSYSMVVGIMIPSLCVISSHKKEIESSPSMIFPQGIETLRY